MARTVKSNPSTVDFHPFCAPNYWFGHYSLVNNNKTGKTSTSDLFRLSAGKIMMCYNQYLVHNNRSAVYLRLAFQNSFVEDFKELLPSLIIARLLDVHLSTIKRYLRKPTPKKKALKVSKL